jgi:hypothetical protein
MDGRMDELRRLVEPGNRLGGVEGEPGWLIERREDGETLGYENWPHDAHYRACVDSNSYSLLVPELFVDRKTFFRYVAALVGAYKTHHPEDLDILERIENAIRS